MSGPVQSSLTQQTTQTVIDGGYVTSAGVPFAIPLREGYDFFELINLTQMATTEDPGVVVKSEWQNGFSTVQSSSVPIQGIVYSKTTSTNALNGSVVTAGGFEMQDTSGQFTSGNLGPLIASTGITNAAPPVVSVASTTGIVAGQVYRVTSSTNAMQIAGMDFTIGTVVTNTSFALQYMVAPGSAATSANVQQINFQPLYYPRKRYIVSITNAFPCVVVLSVTHGYNVGEFVQFEIPSVYGTGISSGLNQVRGEITAINLSTNSITVNLDTTAMGAFTFPVNSDVPFTFAQTVPTGEIPQNSNSATYNTGVLQMYCGSAVCGASGDVMFWRGTKAFRYSYGVIPTS